MDGPSDDPVFKAALDRLQAAYTEALTLVRRCRSHTRYQRATELGKVIRAMYEDPERQELRARGAAEIAEDEELSLRGLAKRIYVSTTLAKRFRDAAETGPDEELP